MEFVRTPEARFANLDGYPFEPNYENVPDGEGGKLRIQRIGNSSGLFEFRKRAFCSIGASEAAPTPARGPRGWLIQRRMDALSIFCVLPMPGSGSRLVEMTPAPDPGSGVLVRRLPHP